MNPKGIAKIIATLRWYLYRGSKALNERKIINVILAMMVQTPNGNQNNSNDKCPKLCTNCCIDEPSIFNPLYCQLDL